MNKSILFAIPFSIFLFLLANTDAFAAHIMGGEMTYDCTSSGQYTITMKIYRDCSTGGAAFDSQGINSITGKISVWQGDVLFIPTVELDAPIIRSIDSALDTCLTAGTGQCIQEGTYTIELNLPVNSETYTIVYQRCCRSAAISNIINPGSVGFTCYVQINPASQDICNDSPEFADDPLFTACVSQLLFESQRGVDESVDTELSYSFCRAQLGGGLGGLNGDIAAQEGPGGIAPNPDLPPPYMSATYILPTYLHTQPLGQDAQTDYEETSGLLTGLPTTTGTYVMTMCMKEKQNGILMSEVRREFLMSVVNCNEQAFSIVDTTVAIGSVLHGIEINQDTFFTIRHDDPDRECDSLAHFDVHILVGTQVIENTELISAFPNPFSDELTILSSSGAIKEIQLYAINGKLLRSVSSLSDNQIKLNTYSIEPGMYLLVTRTNEGNFVNRIIKSI